MWKDGFQLMELKFAPWLKEAIWKGILPSLVAGICGLVWVRMMQVGTVLDLPLGTTVVSAVYLLCILLFCLDKDEYQQLKQLFERFVWQRTEAVLAHPNEL